MTESSKYSVNNFFEDVNKLIKIKAINPYAYIDNSGKYGNNKKKLLNRLESSKTICDLLNIKFQSKGKAIVYALLIDGKIYYGMSCNGFDRILQPHKNKILDTCKIDKKCIHVIVVASNISIEDSKYLETAFIINSKLNKLNIYNISRSVKNDFNININNNTLYFNDIVKRRNSKR